MNRHQRRWLCAALLPAALVVSAGCEWLQDRFRSCRDITVDLVNQQPSGPAVNLTPEHEAFSADNLVPAGGSRRVVLCGERGDSKRFRVGLDGQTLSIANCVVSRAEYEYESLVVRVVWDRGVLSCQNW